MTRAHSKPGRLLPLRARSDNELPFTLPKFYPITDARISGMSHAEQVERLAKGGATFIQLREKDASPRVFYAAALEAVQVARRLGVRVIINDRVDIAMAVGADGVHLGQDDLPPEKARALLGEDRIIGFSTHDLKQALAASFAPVDYVALGPVFRTSTKEKPDPVVGLAGISEVRETISKPLVAIGGITLERAKAVIESGADSVAIISDLYSTEDVAERARRFIRLLG
jgi:thiamine-phosphate pyrophosphorylase